MCNNSFQIIEKNGNLHIEKTKHKSLPEIIFLKTFINVHNLLTSIQL